MADRQTGTALITGASSGIGREFALLLAARGLDIVITARRQDRLDALATEVRDAHQVDVQVIAHDLGLPGAGEALYAQIAEAGKNIAVLINNAGFGVYGNAWEMDHQRVKTMLELNMMSLTALTQLVCADMVKRGHGRVLQVSSIGAFQPSPLYAAYSATKAYVLFYSQALNYELKGTGVTVTTLCPGLTETEFHQVADHLKPKSMDKLMMSARKVAAIGLKAMDKGKAVVTPGVMNKLSQWTVGAMPRSWATSVAGRMMKSKREDT